jgi:hypothetical protein
VYCMYGSNISTVTQLVFNVALSKDIAPLLSSYMYGCGNSVVAFASLRLCDRCGGVAILRFCGMTQG